MYKLVFCFSQAVSIDMYPDASKIAVERICQTQNPILYEARFLELHRIQSKRTFNSPTTRGNCKLASTAVHLFHRFVMVLLFLLLMVAMASAHTAFGSAADVNIFSDITTEPPIQVQCKLANLLVVVPEQSIEYGHHVGFGFKPNIWGTTRYNCDFKWGSRWQSFDVWVDDFWLSVWLKRPCLHCLWHVNEVGFLRDENGHDNPYLAYVWKQ